MDGTLKSGGFWRADFNVDMRKHNHEILPAEPDNSEVLWYH
jgi:hypothetical protein